MLDNIKQKLKPIQTRWRNFKGRNPIWAALVTNLGGAFVLGVLILWSIFNIFMPIYTRHGISRTLPDVIGKPYQEAIDELEGRGLTVMVVDSTYNPKKPKQIVLEQEPKAGYVYKSSRKVRLIINRVFPPNETVPDLHGQSIDLVKERLKALNITIGNISYRPSPFKNAVVAYAYKGVLVARGQDLKIRQGETIDIQLGNGTCNGFSTPNVMGRSLKEAINRLAQDSLSYQVDSSKYIPEARPGMVFSQAPYYTDSICKGQSVYLTISKKRKK